MTPQERKVMELALEALETKSFDLHSEWGGPFNGETKLKELQLKAITALQEALTEQPAQQEPVAWMFQHEETGRTMCIEAQQLGWGFEKGNPRLKKIAPLYTTPPQRPWVGLTDEEIKSMDAGVASNSSFYAGVLWAEAKLKEKNHDPR